MRNQKGLIWHENPVDGYRIQYLNKIHITNEELQRKLNWEAPPIN